MGIPTNEEIEKIKKYNRHIKRSERHEKVMQRAARNEDHKALRSANFHALRCYSFRLISCIQYLQGVKKVPTREEIKLASRLVDKLDLFKPCDELVLLDAELKEDGTYRYLMSFGEMNKLRQFHLRRVFYCMSDRQEKPVQFACKGLGRNHAAIQVRKHYAQGYQFVKSLDIKTAFRRFSAEELYKYFYIPEKVCLNVMCVPGMHWRLSRRFKRNNKHYLESCKELALLDTLSPFIKWDSQEGDVCLLTYVDQDWQLAQKGLIEGSLLSPLAFELLMRWVVDRMPGNVRVVNYSDNFLLMGKTKEAVVNAENKLRELLSQHPMGKLYVHRHDLDNLSTPDDKGFEFLGYRFLRDDEHGLIIREPLKIQKRLRKSKRKCLTL